MIKKTITYENYNGEQVTDDFYFNLNKAELLKLETSYAGGLSDYIQKIVKTKDVKNMMSIFEEILAKSYGVKSDDGKRFIKNQYVLDEFMQTEAYSDLYIKLATDVDEATAFIQGVIPKGMKVDQSALASLT